MSIINERNVRTEVSAVSGVGRAVATITARPITLGVGILAVSAITFALPAQLTNELTPPSSVATQTAHQSDRMAVLLVSSDGPATGCGAYNALCEGSRLTGNVVEGVSEAGTKCAKEATVGVIGDALGMTKGSKWDRLKKAAKTLGKKAGAPGLVLSCVNAQF